MSIESIELKNIQGIIPNKLISKFKQNNIYTIGDVLDVSKENFEKFPYVGKKVSEEFLNFKEEIQKYPEKFIKTNFQNQPKIIPFQYNKDLLFLEYLKQLIEDFFEVINKFPHQSKSAEKRFSRDIDIIRKFYGFGSKQYEIDKIAIRHKINKERVRQIIVLDFQEDLKTLLNGDYLEKWKVSVRDEVIEVIDSFKIEIAGKSVWNKSQLTEILKDYGYDNHKGEIEELFNLLMNLWGYNMAHLSRYYHLQENTIYLDDSINSELFLNVCTKIYKYLKEKIIITPVEDIIIAVLEEFDVDDEFIIQCCESLNEIENPKPEHYKVRFDKLSSINDYAHRLIYEKQKPLSYGELLHMINKRLVLFDNSITMESLKQTLRRDENVIPIGKTGSWSLKSLNSNVESQKELILKSFRILDKPLTVDEITEFIHKRFSRTDVTKSSIRSNLRNYKKYFLKIKHNRFILSEQKEKYRDQIVETKEPRKKRTKLKATKTIEIISKYLDHKSDKTYRLSDLVKDLVKNELEFSRMDIYKAIRENPLVFKKIKDSNGKIFLTYHTVDNSNLNFIEKKYN